VGCKKDDDAAFLHIKLLHDAFPAVNAATIASKMTIAAVNQACHRRR